MSSRSIGIGDKGSDVAAWENVMNAQLRTWRVPYKVPEDGVWSAEDRSMMVSICHGFGLPSGSKAMKDGVTPELRVKLRNKRQTPADKVRYAARAGWRRAFAKRFKKSSVAPITGKVIADSWRYHPGIHDGMDIITPQDAPFMALCDGVIVRVSASDWWGLGAPSDPGLKAKGDGIIIMRCTTNQGPFKAGLNMCYGHVEKAVVKEGDKVKAGQMIGRAGLAVAWHSHFMVNGRNDTRGVGDRDPYPFYKYAMKA